MGTADDGLLFLRGVDLEGLHSRIGRWRRRRLPMEEGGRIVQCDILPCRYAVSSLQAEFGLIENRGRFDAETRLRFGVLFHGKFFNGGIRSRAPMDDIFRQNVAFQNGCDGEFFASLDTCVLRQKTDDPCLCIR